MRRLSPLLSLCGLPALLLSTSVFAQYDIVEFSSGQAVRQTALIAEGTLYVFSAVEDGSRQLQTFPVNEPDAASRTEHLAEDLIFVDEIETSSGKQIALVYRDEARLLSDSSSLLKFDSIYNAPVFQSLPHLNVFRDINGDGLDDFLIPSFDGYQASVQLEDGGFSQATTLEGTPLMDMSYNSHPWYQAKTLFVADLTGDGQTDLAFWEASRFVVYPQLADGSFASQPTFVPTSLGLDYDSVDGMSLRFSNQDQSNNSVKVIHSLADYDNDQIPDLMAMSVKSEGVLNKTTTFSLHPGQMRIDDDQAALVFSHEPVSAVQSNGIQYDMLARDLDSDGDLDLMISSVELGVGKIIGALLTSSIKIDLGFYPMIAGSYPAKAATTRNMTASFSLSSGEYWLPTVQLLDHNGDGKVDLMIQDSDVALSLYEANHSDNLFSNKKQTIRVPVPKDPDLIRRMDVNRDGRSDLLMLVPPALGETEGHRIVLLQSQ